MRYGFQARFGSLVGCSMQYSRTLALALTAATLAPTVAAAADPAPPAAPVSYADLADLADPAGVVVRAVVKDAIVVPPERATTTLPGHARLYIEATTVALLAGNAPLGESLRYLVDVPLDAKGKVPKLKKREFVLFARPVEGRPGELQLIGPTAQLPYDTVLEGRLKPILAELASPDRPPIVTGVRDLLSVPGALVGESETQMFLSTRSGDPASVTVVRRPGMAPAWGVSFSEIVDQAAVPPQRDTLAWYRLACFLPPQLPANANLAQDAASRARAVQDYRFVIEQLGPCPRTLRAR